MRWTSAVASIILGASLLATAPAHAVLGGRATSVDSDTQTMSASHAKKLVTASASTATYTDHEVTAVSTTVHEYENANGQVFAVTWRGIVRPDLKALFGDYYDEYDAASAKIKRGFGRQFTSVDTAHVKVRRGGHMRDINGRAFVPSLVPDGVDAETLP